MAVLRLFARIPSHAMIRRLAAAALLALFAGGAIAGQPSEEIAGRLAQQSVIVAGQKLDVATLRAAYERRQYRPFWFAASGADGSARALHAALQDASREGLEPADYALPAIAERLNAPASESRVDVELLLSAMLIHYSADLRHGRVAPRRADPALFSQPREIDAVAVIERVAASSDIQAELRAMAPANPPYRRLRRALADYRKIVQRGGWQRLAEGRPLKPGMQSADVAALRERLAAGGWLTVESATPELFDSGLELALKQFQRSHLLEADGVLGDKTRAALNVSAEERLRQIVLNMERWRWMPDDLGEFYVIVNMAAYELEVVDAGSVRLAMRVVVGKPYRRTPVFSDRIRYLEFNPVWHVPVKIASQDLLPKEIADPGYLRRNGFRIFSGWTEEARELEPESIDWQQYRGQRLPLKLQQSPGKKNALGRVKFMFPNVHDVYLHDTASPELFDRTLRSFSSGCIRVEKPLELATLLLRDTPGWTRPEIEIAIAGSSTRIARLKAPVPVHLTYATVWLGEGGTLHFAPDVYDRDRALYRGLFNS